MEDIWIYEWQEQRYLTLWPDIASMKWGIDWWREKKAER